MKLCRSLERLVFWMSPWIRCGPPNCTDSGQTMIADTITRATANALVAYSQRSRTRRRLVSTTSRSMAKASRAAMASSSSPIRSWAPAIRPRPVPTSQGERRWRTRISCRASSISGTRKASDMCRWCDWTRIAGEKP